MDASPTPPDRQSPFASSLARIAIGRPRTILVAALLLAAIAGWRIGKLRLDTDFAQLLPKSDPAVLALHEMDRRMAALSSLDVVVQGPDPAANRSYVDALVTRLRALHDPMIDEVSAGVSDERRFFDHQRDLYAKEGQIAEARDRLARTIATRKNPMLTDLDDEGAESLDDIERSFAHASDEFSRFPDGYFAYRDGTLYAVVIWLRSSFLSSADGQGVAQRIRNEALALAAERDGPSLKVGLTGNILTAAEERDALENDLLVATSISVALVCLVVFLFFGRLRALPLLLVPALLGVTCALAFAQLAFGYLNSATGFLGAIIVGNGINFAIIQMARYEEERRAGIEVAEAARRAIGKTFRATGLAAICAAIAYGSLALTDFRGFNQFGYIGGAGMLLTWLATLLVLPALWVLFDRRRRDRPPRVRGFAALAPLGRLTLAHPKWIVAGGLALTAAAILPLPRYLGDPFEYDFDKLRNQVAKRSDSEVLSTRLDPIFGRSLSPSFVLADRPEQVEAIRKKMLARDETRHVLGSVKTIGDFLPGSDAEQGRKLALLSEIRGLVDRNLDLVDDKERATLEKLRPPDDLRPLGARDLPRSIRRFYTEADDTVGRIITYFPREDVNVWDGRVQQRLAEIVRDVTLDDGSRIRSSGWAVIFAAMLDAVLHDGPIVTAISFCAVLLMIALLARGRGAVLIVGSLFVGVLWMLGGVAAAGVRINFLNFIALPITFGIAADYGANLYLRYLQEGPGGLQRAVGSTGSAVALCSLTTIIGYAALLVADTEGLRTFGAAAILGELSCITTAVVLLPAVLALLERRAGSAAAQRARRVA